MQDILYVTSFNSRLYDASGKQMIDSFIKWKIEGDLFIGDEREGIKSYQETDIDENRKGFWYDLNKNQFLKDWLSDNIDIIPEHFGGKGKLCSCTRNPNSRFDRDHKKGCYYSWWNRNASRWFRKIACLHYIINSEKFVQYKYLVWIDADCLFTRTATGKDIIDRAFPQNTDIFYMKGKKRWVIETGIFGIKLEQPGLDFINKLIDAYVSKEFRKWRRWDDGYVFDKIRKPLETSKAITGFDVSGRSINNDVADESILFRFITHFKGRHGRIMNIMK